MPTHIQLKAAIIKKTLPKLDVLLPKWAVRYLRGRDDRRGRESSVREKVQRERERECVCVCAERETELKRFRVPSSSNLGIGEKVGVAALRAGDG